MGLQQWLFKRNEPFFSLYNDVAAVHLITPLEALKHSNLALLVTFSLTPRQIALKIVTQLYEGQYFPNFQLQ